MYAVTMNTFKEGDRVTHPINGEGTMVNPYDGTGWPTVQFDSGLKIMTNEDMLTPVPKAVPKFKIGDRVSNYPHRDGTVKEYSEHSGLYTVDIGGGRVYFALEHQIKLAVPEPKFNVRVMFTNGNEVNAGDKFQQNAEAYLQNLTDWDTIETITINRVKG